MYTAAPGRHRTTAYYYESYGSPLGFFSWLRTAVQHARPRKKRRKSTCTPSILVYGTAGREFGVTFIFLPHITQSTVRAPHPNTKGLILECGH